MECDIFVYENVDAILIQKKLIQTVSSKFYDTNIVGQLSEFFRLLIQKIKNFQMIWLETSGT